MNGSRPGRFQQTDSEGDKLGHEGVGVHKRPRGGWNAGDESDDEVGGWQKQVWWDRQGQRGEPGQQREDETLGVGRAVRLVDEGEDGRGQFRVGVHSGQVLNNSG